MANVITRVPPAILRGARRLFNRVRHAFFTVDVDYRDLDVDMSADELRVKLGNTHFTNSWELSFNYEGEDLNMRLPVRKDDKYEWYQLHVRGWEQDDGTIKIEVHYDLEPTEYPYYHLHPPKDANLGGATEDLIEIFDTFGIPYEKV